MSRTRDAGTNVVLPEPAARPPELLRSRVALIDCTISTQENGDGLKDLNPGSA